MKGIIKSLAALFFLVCMPTLAQSLPTRARLSASGIAASCSSCVLLTGDQTVAGAKTFTSLLTATAGITASGVDPDSGAVISVDVPTGDATAVIITSGGSGNVTGFLVDASGTGSGGEFSGGGAGGTGVIATAIGGNGDGIVSAGNGTGAAIRMTNGSGGTAVAIGNTGRTAKFTSATSAATATTILGAFTFAPTIALDATDLAFDFQSSAGAHLFSVNQSGNMSSTGALASTTEFSLFTVTPNALLTAITLGGTVTAAQPFTVNGVSLYVATQALSTAATTVFTITDGTNTCTATFTCDGSGVASFQGAGAKRVTTVNGAGTGCVYAASAALTIAVTTQGCATAAVVNNIRVVGKWQ